MFFEITDKRKKEAKEEAQKTSNSPFLLMISSTKTVVAFRNLYFVRQPYFVDFPFN